MIKLKTFTLSGVGRFVDKQTIDFTKLGNLVQVDAENKNTGGSSGSGKTTIFHALEYNLGINDLPTSILQSRLTEDGIYTLGEYEVDGKELKILRSKSKFSIEFDGEITSGSSKITEERLDQILGMDRKLFRPMLHKRQKEGGFFLDFTPAKMNEFLVSALGLSEMRKKLELVDAKLKNLSENRQSLENALQAAKAARGSTQNAIFALGGSPTPSVLPSEVEELKRALEKSAAFWDSQEERFGYALAEHERARPETSVDPFDRTQIEAFERGINILKQKVSSIETVERERRSAIDKQLSEAKFEQQKAGVLVKNREKSAKEAIVIADEIKKIRASICPTCEQSWATEAAKDREVVLMDKLKQHKEAMAAGNQAEMEVNRLEGIIRQLLLDGVPRPLPELSEFNEKISELSKKIGAERIKENEHLSKQNEINKTKMSEFLIATQRLRSLHESGIHDAKVAMDNARYSYEIAFRKSINEAEAKARYDKAMSILSKQLQQHENEVIASESKIKEIHSELEVIEEVKKAIKSYVSCSFDDALEQIGDSATRIVRAIPNMSNATIQFEGLRETKAGAVKEEVNAVISFDGEVGVPIKSLSGGERSSVDLAVDLAVIDLLENKTNKGIDVFILDEPFTGLDTVSIEMALEVLKNSNINKKLVIVDHNEEVKQMVESRLLVVREGTTSKIEQA